MAAESSIIISISRLEPMPLVRHPGSVGRIYHLGKQVDLDHSYKGPINIRRCGQETFDTPPPVVHTNLSSISLFAILIILTRSIGSPISYLTSRILVFCSPTMARNTRSQRAPLENPLILLLNVLDAPRSLPTARNSPHSRGSRTGRAINER